MYGYGLGAGYGAYGAGYGAGRGCYPAVCCPTVTPAAPVGTCVGAGIISIAILILIALGVIF